MKNSARLMFLLAWSPGIWLFFVWFHVAVLRRMNMNGPGVWDINSLRGGDFIRMVHLFNMLFYDLLMVNYLCDNLCTPPPYEEPGNQSNLTRSCLIHSPLQYRNNTARIRDTDQSQPINRPITTGYQIWGGINTLEVEERRRRINNNKDGCSW